jgi:hypothetical protein
MKKLLYSKKIKMEVNAFVNSINTEEAFLFLELINNYCSKLNKEYAKKVNELIIENEKLLKLDYIKEINKLVENIAEGEKINVDYLKNKYLNILTMSTLDEHLDDTSETTEVYLEKIIIDGNNFYYENIQGGKVYNSSSEIVGIYNNNKVNLINN